VAELCKTLLEPEFDVIGTVSDGHALLRAAVELKPHVTVLDIAVPAEWTRCRETVKEALSSFQRQLYPRRSTARHIRGVSDWTFLHNSCDSLVLNDPNNDAAVRGLVICRFVLL
jgi:DNA-binding NarL/FixJ family response regulator